MKKSFKRAGLLASVALVAGVASSAMAEDVKIGALGGITGPIANLAPPILDAGQMAADQVNAQGGILGGKLEVVVGDSACAEQNAVDSANKLVNVDQVTAVFGPMCSGAFIAAVNSVSVPSGVVTISASATSPQVTGLDDNDLAYRTAPSDAFQGEASARNALKRGIKKVAISFINNDYGQGLAESFKSTFEAGGGEVTAFAAHEPGKASYRSELATLSGSGADTLVVFAYAGDTGLTIIRQSLENAFFEKFIGGDGMKDDVLLKELGADNLANLILTAPTASPDNPSKEIFDKAFVERGGKQEDVFVGQGYDSVFLLALAIEKAGSNDRSKVAAALRDVAMAPGEPILPGEWKKAAELIKAGKDIDYKGVSGDHEFDAKGDVPGLFAEFVVDGGAYKLTEVLK